MTHGSVKAAAKPKAKKPDPDDGLTQSERFMKAARELEIDDDAGRFKERVRKVAKATARPEQTGGSSVADDL